jgi:hypothetical protein
MSSITSPSVPGGPFSVPPGVVRRTLDALRQQRTEVVCYWLGKTASGVTVVEDVWVPAHNASIVSYSVKPEEMLRLKQRLDETGWAIGLAGWILAHRLRLDMLTRHPPRKHI